MCFTKENVDEVVTLLDRVLTEVRHKDRLDAKIKSLQNLVPSIIQEHSNKAQRPVRPIYKENIKSIWMWFCSVLLFLSFFFVQSLIYLCARVQIAFFITYIKYTT